MNIYDTKVVSCINCKKAIGEIELDAITSNFLCAQCIPEYKNYNLNKSKIKIVQVV